MTDHDARSDALMLRGLAHPIRQALLRELASDARPANVSTLAEAVGEPANSVSFHLRQMEKYGLARRVDPPEGVSRKESWWATVSDEYAIDPQGWGPEGRDAAFEQLAVAIRSQHAARAELLIASMQPGAAALPPGSAGPKVRGQSSESSAWLTADQAAEAQQRLQDLLRFLQECNEANNANRAATQGRYLLGVDFFRDRAAPETD